MIGLKERDRPARPGRCPGNDDVAERLDRVAALLREQGADHVRVRAYRRAAEVVRKLPEPVSAIHARGGLDALEALPGIGKSIARSIANVLIWGRLPVLERLLGRSDGAALLRTVPGIGAALASRLQEELGIESLEELEVAAQDGRLDALESFGPRRLAAVRDTLDNRLARIRGRAQTDVFEIPLVEILAVDDEYRRAASEGRLPRIALEQAQPGQPRDVPVLHLALGERNYTAMFSSTPRAQELGRTRDWVVVHVDGTGADRQYTVATGSGGLAGRRVVRGRESECLAYYQEEEQPVASEAGSRERVIRTPAARAAPPRAARAGRTAGPEAIRPAPVVGS